MINKHLAHATAYSFAVELLLTDGASVQDLMEETGLSDVTCRKLCMCLRRRGVLYIRDWDADPLGRRVRPVYKIGKLNDKPRPPLRTSSQRRRERLARQRFEAAGLGIAQTKLRAVCSAHTVIERAKAKSKNHAEQREKSGDDEYADCVSSTS